MERKCLHFVKILKAELEDLLEDLVSVEENCIVRFEKAEITNYVLLENKALLSREEESIRKLLVSIDGLNPSRYKRLEDIIEELDAIVHEFITDKEYPAAVRRLLRRKMDKVLAYVMMDEAP